MRVHGAATTAVAAPCVDIKTRFNIRTIVILNQFQLFQSPLRYSIHLCLVTVLHCTVKIKTGKILKGNIAF